MTPFIPGLQLSEAFYHQLVAPILRIHFPELEYAAALIGSGSEVLGYDTAQSMDHHWGPRLLLFIPEEGFEVQSQHIHAVLSEDLPYTLQGFSTNFSPPNPDDNNVRHLEPINEGPVNHMVEVFSLPRFFRFYFGTEPVPLEVREWLTLPEQKLLAFTQGAVYHDDPGDLTRLRAQLAYYPEQIWRYLLAVQWTKIGQEEAFLGRCGDVGDDLGSRIVASRLVRYLMKLCFLMERQYAPYSKWFGTAFARLSCGPILSPIFTEVLAAAGWRSRETHLGQAYTFVAHMHNALQITPPLPEKVSNYFSRPYLVIHADAFAAAIQATITDPEVRAISAPIGAIDQFVDSTDVTEHPRLTRRLAVMYNP
jgi:hypothetical protein